MPSLQSRPLSATGAGPLRAAVLSVLVLGLGACAGTGPQATPGDPLEPVNREMHDFNVALDSAVLRPVSMAYGTVAPRYFREKINNISHNFDLPGEIINSALQGRGENAGHNFFRFVLNSTLGVLGIFDPATSFGLERRSTDFGETMFVWGVGEGPFLEVPALGPRTTRHFTGEIVDLFLNPLTIVGLSPPEAYYPPTAYLGEMADYRYEFRNTVDDVLYNSADSYAQTRIIYLETRRYQLDSDADGGGAAAIDPYEDLYGE